MSPRLTQFRQFAKLKDLGKDERAIQGSPMVVLVKFKSLPFGQFGLKPQQIVIEMHNNVYLRSRK